MRPVGDPAIASPAAYDQRRASISGSYRSIRAPSDSSRRVASSTICWRTSAGLEDGRHAGRDLAQRPLRVGPPGDLRARALELVDQAGVGDGDGGLVGQRASSAASSASNASARSP